MRTWVEEETEEGPAQAPGTKMRDVRFTSIFPAGQPSLLYTHALPARLCANADDKNNKAVQRALQDELRHISKMYATECEDTLEGAPCNACGALGIQIMQMPLPALNMPAPTVGVTVMPVCGKPECATAIRETERQKRCRIRWEYSVVCLAGILPCCRCCAVARAGTGGKMKEMSEMPQGCVL
ncbi:MAG: hypothetical protein ALECFALPRED_011025 [Alectoria fallacina]|uniref:Uncharacterized protein n=1 Tax=Alectoria fallacina TaxID=1903189 RepID=A0A8H3JAB7_9LECA|nr:MAG: hypothetical protein ALECFALPRED_011025 [Alectoria fallacina]